MRSFPLAGVLLLVAWLPATSRAQDPATFYDDNCATCHTIGGGVLGGPDLKGITARRDRDRLIRFLLDPDAFANDPLRVQMIKDADGLAMGPTEGLTRDLAEKLLLFIEQQSGGIPSPPAEAFAPLTPEEAVRGRAIFEGRTPLAAGGAACVACHSGGDLPAFAGGRLAPDLGDVHQRLGGGKGLTAWLGGTPTPMMRSLYSDARLTAEEARGVAAFLETTSAAPPVRRAGFPHVLGGLTGGLLALALIAGVGHHRFRSVRRPMVDAARRHARTLPGRHTLGGLR